MPCSGSSRRQMRARSTRWWVCQCMALILKLSSVVTCLHQQLPTHPPLHTQGLGFASEEPFSRKRKAEQQDDAAPAPNPLSSMFVRAGTKPTASQQPSQPQPSRAEEEQTTAQRRATADRVAQRLAELKASKAPE
jgi:hypothetical protein